MATKREHTLAYITELHQLQMAWTEAFDSGDNWEASAEGDMNHLPPALAKLIKDIIEEGVDGINNRLSDLTEDGALKDGKEVFDAAMEMTLQFSRFLCARMYRLGAKLAVKLPYDNMTPCPCSVMTDEDFADLDDFLAVAAQAFLPDLEGGKSGKDWTIKSFDSNKKPE